jgi:hypothetical protein
VDYPPRLKPPIEAPLASALVLRTLAVLFVLFVTGAPIALCIARVRFEWTRLVFEALLLGLLVQLAVAFVLMRTDHFTRLGAGVLTAVVIVAGVIGCRWRAARAWPEFDVRWVGAVIALVAVALLFRTHPTYFIFETGDMGEYVNRANRVAQGAPLLQSFPHGFTLFLASTNLLLGEAHTVAGLPALGITFLLGIVTLAKTAGVRVGAVLIVGLIVAVHPITVWFSTFPVSEALYSVVIVCVLYGLMRARLEASAGYAVFGGLMVGALLIVRGNGMLFAPILVAVLLASAAADEDDTYRVQRVFTITGLVSLAVAYAYNVRFLPDYFVHKQLQEFVPGFVFRGARTLHLLGATGWLFLAAVAGLALVLVSAHALRRFVGPAVRGSEQRFWRATFVAVIGVTVIVLLVGHASGLGDGLGRWGPAVLVLASGGVLLAVVRPGRYLDGPTTLLLISAIASYSILFAIRYPHPRNAPYYLYTDRYLFSEVLPLALLVVAIAVDALFEAFARTDRPVRRIAVAAAFLVIALEMVPALVETHRVTSRQLFGDAYGTLDRVDRMTRTQGLQPIVFSGLATMPDNWFVPETYRAFAVPLDQTFRRRILGTPFEPGHRDPQFDPAGALAVLQKAGRHKGYLVALRGPGAVVFPDDAHTKYLGTIDYPVPVLRRRIDRSQERFHTVPLQLDVYVVADE